MSTQENEQLAQAEHAAKALMLWREFTETDKLAVRMGMLPMKPCKQALADGYDARMLGVALFDIATKQGGMIA